MTQGERIKHVRLNAELTQEKFGAKIKIAAASVSLIESGKNNASDQTIDLICKEFGINEHWLRTGEGEMQTKTERDQEITTFLGSLLSDDTSFQRRLISVLARMTPDEWAILERKLKEVLEQTETPPSE